jgi:hypothetical protein
MVRRTCVRFVMPTLKGLTAAVNLTPIGRKDEAMQWTQPRTAQLRATGTEISRLGPGAGPAPDRRDRLPTRVALAATHRFLEADVNWTGAWLGRAWARRGSLL